jgi:hypothetical protein
VKKVRRAFGRFGAETTRMSDPTPDFFFNGRLSVRQPRDGYRFSIDAVLLGHLAAPRPRDRIVDLGAGCGIVSLILACRYPDVRIRGIELQSALAALARENVSRNRLGNRIEIEEADLRTLGPENVSTSRIDRIIYSRDVWPRNTLRLVEDELPDHEAAIEVVAQAPPAVEAAAPAS